MINQRVLDKLKEGVVPWKQNWTSIKYGAPFNYIGKYPYTGINYFMLMDVPVPYFATMKQWTDRGYYVRQKAQAYPIFFWKILLLDRFNKPTSSAAAVKRIPYVRPSFVYHILDVAGFTADMFQTGKEKGQENIIYECQSILEQNPHTLKLGEPSYNFRKDYIKMPLAKSFDSMEDYYKVYFHELSHWTGHEERLNRGLKRWSKETKEDYSIEEMVAEMCSTYLCSETGIMREDFIDQTASYVRHYEKLVANQPDAFLKACRMAEKAYKFLVQKNIANEESGTL